MTYLATLSLLVVGLAGLVTAGFAAAYWLRHRHDHDDKNGRAKV